MFWVDSNFVGSTEAYRSADYVGPKGDLRSKPESFKGLGDLLEEFVMRSIAGCLYSGAMFWGGCG